jgi:anaerobic selenocysteine-containing dehydrogenase
MNSKEERIHYRACNLCEAICGVEVHIRAGEITAIRGDEADPFSRGHVCPKAVALKDLYEDPDRLKTPLRRTATGWEKMDWDAAFDHVAERLMAIHDAHGPNAIANYAGNPSVHNLGSMTHLTRLLGTIKSRNRYSATSVDQLPHQLMVYLMYGHQLLVPIADIDRCDYLLVLGANPMASNGSLMTVPDFRGRLKALQARGGKLVLLDPRRTETAEVADQHLFIRPGTDAAFLLGLLKIIGDEGLAQPGRLAEIADGLDAAMAAVRALDLATLSTECGIAVDTIQRIAREFANTPRAAVYGRMGVSTQAHGSLCQWLIQLLNLATGKLDREGGMMFTRPAVDLVENPTSKPGSFGRWKSRVRGLPEFGGELPVAALAEEILTPGEDECLASTARDSSERPARDGRAGASDSAPSLAMDGDAKSSGTRIRALITMAGNPVLSTPNGAQLDRALDSLEFMVAIDFYLNETTRHADVILPPTCTLEHDHYDLIFHTFAVRNTARYSEPLFERAAEQRHDWEIFEALGNRVAKHLGLKREAFPRPEQVVDMGLRIGPYGALRKHPLNLSLAIVKAAPHGIDIGALEPCLPQRLAHADKRIRCAPPELLAELARYADALRDARPDTLRLIGRRHVRSNNSWLHNAQRLVKGPVRNRLLMHPADAEARGLSNGAKVVVRSRTGEVVVELEACASVMPGVVSLPHGWGHGRDGVRLRVAQAHAGVSPNDLTDERFLDAVSGNAALNGVPVTVVAAS